MLAAKRVLPLLLLSGALPARAQFASLSTTNDGSVLFFTTPLGQIGTNQPNYGKVFIADTRGVRLLLARDRLVTPGELQGFPAHTTNVYDLVGVSSAGDISQLAIAGVRECQGYTSGLCGFPDSTDIYNARGENILTVDGHVTVSRNGKWGLVAEDPLYGGGILFSVIDLTTLRKYTSPESPEWTGKLNWGRPSIADDGTAVIVGTDRLSIFRPPDFTQTISSAGATSAAIDAGAITLVWRDTALRVLKLGGASASPMLLDPDGDNPQISADGSRILYSKGVTGVAQLFLLGQTVTRNGK